MSHSVDIYLLKKQIADIEPLSLLGERTAKRESSLMKRAESNTRCGESHWGPGRAQPAARAMPEPCPHRASASRPARARGAATERCPGGESPPPWSSTGHAFLQQHLLQSWRVSPHQGTFREQSTWSRASASPRFLTQSVPPPQSLCSAASFT